MIGAPTSGLADLVSQYEATWRATRAEGRRLDEGGRPEENERYVEACADCARQRAAVALHPAASIMDVLLKVRVFVAEIAVEEDAADLAREIGWRDGQAYDDDVSHAVMLDLARLAPSITGSGIVS